MDSICTGDHDGLRRHHPRRRRAPLDARAERQGRRPLELAEALTASAPQRSSDRGSDRPTSGILTRAFQRPAVNLVSYSSRLACGVVSPAVLIPVHVRRVLSWLAYPSRHRSSPPETLNVMSQSSAIRVYALPLAAAALLGVASPLFAQFTPQSVERAGHGREVPYRGAVGFWNPGAEMSISSESLGHSGRHHRLQERPRPDRSAIPRAARWCCGRRSKHKLRFQYIPIGYTQHVARPSTARSIIFNGQLYHVGLPVNSTSTGRRTVRLRDTTSSRRTAWFAGLHARASTPMSRRRSSSRWSSTEYAHAGARFRPSAASCASTRADVSITGELSRFRIPDSRSDDIPRALHRPRHLRHRQHHQQLRRAGRLPLVRRRLPREEGHRIVRR